MPLDGPDSIEDVVGEQNQPIELAVAGMKRLVGLLLVAALGVGAAGLPAPAGGEGAGNAPANAPAGGTGGDAAPTPDGGDIPDAGGGEDFI